jgi:hypothetical protein
MNTSTVDHSWANNARWCADQRYFQVLDDKGYGDDLDRAYRGWQSLSEMSTMYRILNG